MDVCGRVDLGVRVGGCGRVDVDVRVGVCVEVCGLVCWYVGGIARRCCLLT